MFKMTFSKIKKLCSVALIPRILRDEVTLSPRKLGKRPLDGFWKMAKSTDSKDRQAECAKCKKIIEMVFGPEKPDSLLKQVEANVEDIHIDKIQKVIAPNITSNSTVNEKSNEGNDVILVENTEQRLGPEENLTDKSTVKNSGDQATLPLDNILESTTAKATEEQLAQKLETIEEPGLVEAATPKTEGYITPPKVLGSQENILDTKNSLYTKIGPEEDAMDEIAKKCLGTPPDKIDERILEEMKSCGMLGRGRKKPTSKKSGYHAMKYNNKEALFETKSEQSTLYYKNLQTTNNSFNNYPMRYHNMKFAHNPQSIYPAYFKNVPLGLIGDGLKKSEEQKIPTEQKEEKTTLQDAKTNLAEENPVLLSSDRSAVADSNKKNFVTDDQNCGKTEILEETPTETINIVEEKPKEIFENIEVEVEEIRVTAAETSRLGIPGETEIEPDFNNKNTNPEISTCHEILQAAETPIEENVIEPDQKENVVLSNSKHPTDWHFRPDLEDRPFTNRNTAISSTFPIIDQKENPEAGICDTSISSKQNPEEYFDLSHCHMEKAKDNEVITLSEIRPLAAFHQYTILTGTEEEAQEPEHLIFSAKHTPEISLPNTTELNHEAQNDTPNPPEPVNKDISAAMGPLPQLKDMEEELSLSELLRRVRERNRLQYCRECAFKALEVEPAEANKCPPPLDKGPSKTLGPGPCKPKPKPACPPPPPTCPPPASPCKPKDPCAKFSKTSIIGDKIKEAFTLVLQVAFKPAFASPGLSYTNKMDTVEPLRGALSDEDANRIEKLSSFLLSSNPENEKKSENEEVILAKDYEPWSPIPSWPIPNKEKKQPFVCPKEGCKIIPPPRLNAPCKENPCINLPKRTFSLIEFEYEPLYLYNNEF